MVPLSGLWAVLRETWTAWERTPWSELEFARRPDATLVAALVAAIPLLVLLARAARAHPRRRRQVALPAVLGTFRRSPLSPLRHAAYILFVIGIPFVALAAADPRSAFLQENVSYSGRRIAILIDGSGSMILPFETQKLRPAMQRSFYVAVSAAEYFLQLRMESKHVDQLALIEFGNEAFVVTPFTTDYENVILSLRLVGEPRAWNRFNVFGTTIIQGLEQGLRLFSTFDLLEGEGNMMIIITDGNDGETNFRGRTLDQMMEEARNERIPISMVRVGYGKPLGDIPYDSLWKPTVERTGGRFYAAYDEASLVRALEDINRAATGRTVVRQYAAASPMFGGYALIGAALWLAAATLTLAFPYFRTFP